VEANLPKEVLNRVWRGAHETRAGDVLYVPAGYNFLDGGISHSVPWPYMQRVPMVWYGPGVIRQGGRIDRQVTSADVAPTLGELTGVRFETPDAAPMDEILEPDRERPRLVVVFVWDASGRYVLDLWPGRWPNLKRLMDEGTWYENATVGSSPSTTAPIHATMGTGRFPRTHGILDNWVRFEDGSIEDPWEATNRKAVIGTFATLAWHLGMMGHGKQGDPASRQLAVLRQSVEDTGAEGVEWGLREAQAEYYRFPDYITELPPLSSYLDAVDASDGTVDGAWMGHPFEELKGGFHTPARVPYQQRAIEEVVIREGFGADDDATDLLFVNSKLIDEVGHESTASGEEMGVAVAAQDAGLPDMVDLLNRAAGEGRWAMLVTADHGHTAHPDLTGGFRVKIREMEERFVELFGDDSTVERVRTSWMFVDRERLAERGATLDELAAFVNDLTQADVSRNPSSLTPAEQDKHPFAAAISLDEVNGASRG
jgi:hypothetical protein